MKQTTQSMMAVVLVLVMTAGVSSSLAQDVYTFGSDNDGLAGFTTNAVADTNSSWTVSADSVQYRNQNNGTQNSSLLREFVLDRSEGKSYVISGEVTMTDGYADDNNRLGMYLFGDSPEVPNEDEVGAIGIVFNTDDSATGGFPGNNAQDNLNLRVGIDSTAFATVLRNQDPTSYAQDLFGTTMTFDTTITFVSTNIEVVVSMTDKDGSKTEVSTTVRAEDYTGDYFGFINRCRARYYPDTTNPRGRPWVMDYRTFTFTRPIESIGTVLQVR